MIKLLKNAKIHEIEKSGFFIPAWEDIASAVSINNLTPKKKIKRQS